MSALARGGRCGVEGQRLEYEVAVVAARSKGAAVVVARSMHLGVSDVPQPCGDAEGGVQECAGSSVEVARDAVCLERFPYASA